jgi:hypothetical protein
MSNTLLTISDITNEGLMILENELTLADKINREFDDKFGVDGAKIGYTINLRRPARFTVSGGPALQVQDFVEGSTPATLTNQAHIDTQFITSDLLLSMDMFKKRVLKPKIAALANNVDAGVATQMRIGTANIVGTPGTLPTGTTGLQTFLNAGAILDTEAAPRDGERYAVLDQFSQATMVGGLTGLFNPQMEISEQYRKGLMARNTVGADWYMDQNVTNQTWGSWAGAPKFGTAGVSSALISSGWADSGTLYCTGFTASTAVVNVGDTFTVATVLMVNPQNRAATKQLRTFVVRPPVGTPSNGTFSPVTDVFGNIVGGTYTSDGSGILQLTVAVALITAGQFQNVSSAPANNAVLVPSGTAVTGPQNLLFHRDAFTLISADLPLVRGVEDCARASDKDVGMSMRIVRQYTIGNDAIPTRIDILYGVAAMYRELACRVTG